MDPRPSDFDVLRSLVFPSGRVRRAKLQGRPTRDCLFVDVTRDERTALKVWNVNARGGVLACFNIQGAHWSRERGVYAIDTDAPRAVTATLRVTDVVGLREAARAEATAAGRSDVEELTYACKATGGAKHGGTKISILREEDAFARELEGKAWEIYAIAPVMRRGDVEFTPIALEGMLNGGGAVAATSLSAPKGEEGDGGGGGGGGGGAIGVVSVYGCGALACYANFEPTRVSGAFYTLVPIRPRSRGERRSLRTFPPGVSLRPGFLAFNPHPRRLSTPTDAFQLHPVVVDGMRTTFSYARDDGTLVVNIGTAEGTHDVRVEFGGARRV